MKTKRGQMTHLIYIILGLVLFFIVLFIITKYVICGIFPSIPVIC